MFLSRAHRNLIRSFGRIYQTDQVVDFVLSPDNKKIVLFKSSDQLCLLIEISDRLQMLRRAPRWIPISSQIFSIKNFAFSEDKKRLYVIHTENYKTSPYYLLTIDYELVLNLPLERFYEKLPNRRINKPDAFVAR